MKVKVMKLLLSALTKFIFGVLIVGVLIFLPAGSFYIDGIAFMLLLFIPVFVMGVLLFIKAPELLKKRLKSKEKENSQSKVIAFSALIFLFGFILAGLDFRFGWTYVSAPVKIIGAVLFLVSYALYAEIMRENAYLSRVIEVQEDQRVIDTGLYSIVRHPMYLATIIMFLSIPLILGSLVSFAVFLAYPVVVIFRIKSEEQILTNGLNGYAEYKQKVKYRLIPFIW